MVGDEICTGGKVLHYGKDTACVCMCMCVWVRPEGVCRVDEIDVSLDGYA